MNQQRNQRAGVAILALALLVPFQNCGKAFQSTELSSEIPHGLTTVATTLNVYKSSAQVSDSLPLATNTAYEIRLEGEPMAPASVDWRATNGVGGFANCSVTGTAPMIRSLSCSSVGRAHIEVTISFNGTPPITRSFERQVEDVVTPLPPNQVIVFTIPAGTANKPWNTPATAPLVFKGQVLRITNGDSVPHRLHAGGTPCPHQPSASATGQSYDCVINGKQAATAANMYDHDAGNSAPFYIEAIDGAEQYNRKFAISGALKGCVDCHGALATSARKNATFADIKAAIAANRGGMSALGLTDNEIKAIAYELAK